MSSAAKLISVDWGTTSLRCRLAGDDGTVLEQVRAERGILKSDGQPFGDILFEQIEPWLEQIHGTRKPIIMSGMIGSRQGWQEAAYLRCPASPADLANNLQQVDTEDSSLSGCDVRIVPGMDVAGDETGDLPDVMRGEETQVLGALLDSGEAEAAFVLPGTHSKWVFVEHGEIREFRTFMTGEIYAALLDATIVGQLADGDAFDDTTFGLGVEAAVAADDWGGPGNLLNMVFSARSRVLHGELAETAVRSYLSGLLIAAEMLAGADAALFVLSHEERDQTVFRLIGEQGLCEHYARAAELSGLRTETINNNPVPIAHFEIAKLAGLVA